MLEFCVLFMVFSGNIQGVGYTREEIRSTLAEHFDRPIRGTDEDLNAVILSLIEQGAILCHGGRYRPTDKAGRFLNDNKIFKFVRDFMPKSISEPK